MAARQPNSKFNAVEPVTSRRPAAADTRGERRREHLYVSSPMPPDFGPPSPPSDRIQVSPSISAPKRSQQVRRRSLLEATSLSREKPSDDLQLALNRLIASQVPLWIVLTLNSCVNYLAESPRSRTRQEGLLLACRSWGLAAFHTWLNFVEGARLRRQREILRRKVSLGLHALVYGVATGVHHNLPQPAQLKIDGPRLTIDCSSPASSSSSPPLAPDSAWQVAVPPSTASHRRRAHTLGPRTCSMPNIAAVAIPPKVPKRRATQDWAHEEKKMGSSPPVAGLSPSPPSSLNPRRGSRKGLPATLSVDRGTPPGARSPPSGLTCPLWQGSTSWPTMSTRRVGRWWRGALGPPKLDSNRAPPCDPPPTPGATSSPRVPPPAPLATHHQC